MYSMTIQLQTNSGKCLYEQIYEHIRQEIREGKLLAGERLPSTRSLAEYLQVSRSTVDYAYDQLLSEGYIEARPCRGFFVCSMDELFALQLQPRGIKEEESGGRREEEAEGAYFYDFSPNAIDMSVFPFGIWKKITRNILNDSNQELFAQGEPQGDEDLRRTIGRYLHSSRGVNCSPQQILIGAGNDYLLLLLEKILGGGRKLAMENPTYKRACHIFRSMEYEILQADMDESGMLAESLAGTGADMAYVMPSHQFPTGIVMPITRRTQLLSWAYREENHYLIEDDYDSEFRYYGKPIPSLQASDRQGKVIYIGTFSKAIAPAIRVSYMVLPMELLKRYRERCYFYSCTVSRIDQRILNEFIRDGYFERHLNKMRKVYKLKQELLLECLRPFEKDFAVSGENAGLHVVLTAKRGVTERQLVEQAKQQGVKVYGISESLMAEKEGKPSLLLGFGGLSHQEIIEGTKRLEKAWGL
ncbi:MAG: PLP-dependent aminotransferase family protein [Roseburia sp.]|nr:PLP-dependent aminotransferase family protein [Roseburia sp.]